ncbi:DUF4190 domain-containing protein [Rhodococcus opacus]|uniref:DUF4190 domain-containing protein n=1 Tax=Rhodococcus opacus TaxID=37919 RepID=A0A076EZT7_RHOOP|nr:DUF4190 domain-containing protein [Rhodococcus opacus]AII11470.1 hypothetical protein EP51_46735 [Rhodococcus opacus]
MVTFDETDLGIETPERTNICAIVGLFCALTGLFLPALVFGAIGYVETGGREHETGSGLAVAALILGAIELVAGVLTAVIVLVSMR